MRIGELAKQAQVHVETVRYYERQGLITQPPRTESGYRQYPEDAVRRIRFIKRAQELGVSLKEIAELLALRVDADRTCADGQKLAEMKIADIEQKLLMLEQMKQALSRLAAMCQQQRAPTSVCPVLDALEHGNLLQHHRPADRSDSEPASHRDNQ